MLVSIITPTLNSKAYIEYCLRSVLAQDYQFIEHIIVDGGSTDGTVQVLEKFAMEHPGRIRFISEPDRGPGDAWNKGLKMAKGDILGWLGSDDEYLLNAVEDMMKVFNESPDSYLIYGGFNIIDSDGKIVRVILPRKYSLFRLINRYQMIPTHSAFYRKEVLDKTGFFDDIGNDLDFFIKLAKNYPVKRLDKIISNFRAHPGSYTLGSNPHEVAKRLKLSWLTSRRHGGFYMSSYALRYFLYRLNNSVAKFF